MSTSKRPPPTVHLAAGLTTGMLSAVLLQPADLLKTRLQQAHATTLRDAVRAIAAHPQPVRQLWRGTQASVLRTGLGSGVYFALLARTRQVLAARSAPVPSAADAGRSSTLPALAPSANLAAGAAARTAAGMLLMPLTVLKVRYESTAYAYASLPEAARATWRADGVRGFFAGAGATALRDAPYAGLYVAFYEAAKSGLGAWVGRRYGENAALPPSLAAPVNFAAGVSAAAAATALTNPFDAVKTRIQLAPKKYSNLARGAAMMVRDEGWRTLFDGMGLRMARKALSSAIAWTLYEELVRVAEKGMA